MESVVGADTRTIKYLDLCVSYSMCADIQDIFAFV